MKRGDLLTVGAAAVVVVVFVLLLWPSPSVTYEAMKRSTSRNNLRQFGIAVHNRHDDIGRLPAGTHRVGNRSEHGWTTALLPYLDQEALYDRIDLEQPWDHLVNVDAMQERIEVFENPAIETRFDEAGRALANYAGNAHVISAADPMRFEEITDGAANTLLMGEVNGNLVAWGHPRNFRDPSHGINRVPHGFGAPWQGGGAAMVFADGRVHWFADDTDPVVLRALATPNGGEPTPD